MNDVVPYSRRLSTRLHEMDERTTIILRRKIQMMFLLNRNLFRSYKNVNYNILGERPQSFVVVSFIIRVHSTDMRIVDTCLCLYAAVLTVAVRPSTASHSKQGKGFPFHAQVIMSLTVAYRCSYF